MDSALWRLVAWHEGVVLSTVWIAGRNGPFCSGVFSMCLCVVVTGVCVCVCGQSECGIVSSHL